MAITTAARAPTKTSSIDKLFAAAKAASDQAYAKYSGFHVGAALLTASGKTYTGCNVENVSYPLGTCAEEAAIAAARTAEGDGLRATDIAIYANFDSHGHVPCTPCGGCRQRIFEFGPEITVHFFGTGLRKQSVSAANLLPHAFNF